ncbi:TetR/AcrR family transcriptional regulator [Streptomyces sp. HNM0574]|uniref:TetR/AcrR family transcriptional regulator n=1 Tax=Streptomyces sp. HNM0574 TaxID=2714954 RepID=UPI00146DBBBB|nr:TetR/AcrR family transcriptional regulator [Streptomyces sp. HNM0574]NLU66965.1 TetR/AcrR family transcriptional regulator [Streptomyces sp. HNM0574]
MPTPTSTRSRILDAAERLMRTIGLARTTTKEIAREAGCSEAALYKHFTNKEELFVHVLWERLPRLNPLLDELNAEGAGASRPVEDSLVEIARQAALFYERSVPIAASLHAEPALKQRHYAALRELGAGPRLPLDALSRYLRTQRDAGRLRADADTDAAAALLLGACAQRAFLHDFSADEPPQPLDDFARALARTLLTGLT